jgi:hypothetical protein
MAAASLDEAMKSQGAEAPGDPWAGKIIIS